MQLSRRIPRRLVTHTIAVLGCAWLTCSAAAEEPLRWKFVAGQKLVYQLDQSMDMNIQAGAQGQITTSTKNLLEIGWNVQEVNEQGEAKIVQSIDRVKITMSGPPGQSFEYDSKSEEAPTGMAAMLAPTFEAMTTGQMEFTINPRGEVGEVTVSEDLLAALNKAQGGGAADNAAAADGLKTLPSQLALTLPAGDPTPGLKWKFQLELQNPLMGKQLVETTYNYAGTKDFEGKTYAMIELTQKMGDVAGSETIKVNVKEQKSDGQILFNQEAGRLYSSNIKQDLTLELTMKGQTLPATIKNVTDVKVMPAEESKPD